MEWGNKTAKAALATIASRDLDTVERQWGSALDVITSCLRSLFIAAEGHDLICSDYSAIEAVVLAAEAGEEWRLEVFRTHGKIYEASAAMAFGIPLETILQHKITTGKHHPIRKKGKLNELANGYSGWIGASRAFGAIGTDDELKQNILAWREASPSIPEFWGGQWRKEPGKWRFTPEFYGLEGAAVQAILNRGQAFSYRAAVFQYHPIEDCLYELLPSGRFLKYHEPRLNRGINPMGNEVWEMSYMGWNSDSTKGMVGWVRLSTYGGRIAENRCQAIARDILAAAMLRLRAAGYRIVLHVHDEIIVEVPRGFGSIEEVERIMMVREPWFADWPIKAAGGWRGKRYRK